jgi:hypothetical protein
MTTQQKPNISLLKITLGVFLFWMILWQIGAWKFGDAQIATLRFAGQAVSTATKTPGGSEVASISELPIRLADAFIGTCGAGVFTGFTFGAFMLYAFFTPTKPSNAETDTES